MTLLAKSEKNGGLTLTEHTAHVAAAVERIADALGEDAALARRGAILHDLGKAHPYFQRMLRGEVDEVERQTGFPHRHELSSLLFLPLFDRADWPALVEMVVAHHKSTRADRSGRGLFDLIAVYGAEPVFQRHAEAWDEWAPAAIEVAGGFGVVARPVSLDEAREAFDFAVAHVGERPDGWSRRKGVLMSADHFASAYMHEAEKQLSRLYRKPNLEGYRGASDRYRPSPLYPLSGRGADAPEPHTLVVAPTGAGKTNYLFARCQSRVFYTLPYQASINGMYLRVRDDLAAFGAPADVRRVHASSSLSLSDDLEEDVELQRHPGASIKVMTPFQIASVVFGTAGFEAQALDLEGQDVILDEVHTYDGRSRAMLVQLVRMLHHLGCRVHIGTATIPTALADRLVEELGGPSAVHVVRLDPEELDDFDRHRVHTLPDDESAFDTLADALEEGRRMLVVSNRVARAQERFRRIREAFPEVPAMLIHSRFKRGDRNRLEARIREFERMDGPCVVCSTQVVEVSLDVSFDGMITEAAPLDALVQRFGRVNRRRPTDHVDPVWVVAPPEDDRAVLPYDAETVRRSFEVLPDGEVLRERDVQRLMDQVYPVVDVLRMDCAFILDEYGFAIQELQHHPKSALVQALEIDGEACVLASEREAYLRGDAEERQRLLIPVPTSYHRFGWPKLDMGARPFLVPDALYDPGGVPLGLVPDADPGSPSSVFL